MGKLRLECESDLSDHANQKVVMSFPCQILTCHQDMTGHYSNICPMTWATFLTNPIRQPKHNGPLRVKQVPDSAATSQHSRPFSLFLMRA